MEIVSNCCSATQLYETDRCSDCLEHAVFIDLDDENIKFE